MRYALKPLHCRPWLLQGLSPKLIESHYENNYGGALRRLNAIAAQLEAADFAKLRLHAQRTEARNASASCSGLRCSRDRSRRANRASPDGTL